MQEFLEVLAKSMQNAGFPAKASYSSLEVLGCRFYCWQRRNTGAIILDNGFRVRKIRGQGYDIVSAVQYVIQALPGKIAAMKRQKSREEYNAIAERLEAAIAHSGITTGANEGGFFVSFLLQDEARAMCLLDWFQEFMQEEVYRRPDGIRLYVIQDDDGESTPITLKELMLRFDLADEELEAAINLGLNKNVEVAGRTVIRVN